MGKKSSNSKERVSEENLQRPKRNPNQRTSPQEQQNFFKTHSELIRNLLVYGVPVSVVLGVVAILILQSQDHGPFDPINLQRTATAIAETVGADLEDALSAEDWNNLTSQEKILYLERGNVPDIPNFDVDKELIAAALEYSCQVTDCTINPNELAANTVFLNPQQFAAVETQQQGMPTPNAQVRIAITSLDHTHIYINKVEFEKLVTTFKQQLPNVVAFYGDRNIRLLLLRVVVMHEAGHAMTTRAIVTFDTPFFVNVTDAQGRVRIDTASGFQFAGVDEAGLVFFFPLEEQITEVVNIYSRLQLEGQPLIFIYDVQVRLIMNINDALGVTPEEFTAVALRGNMQELARLWASRAGKTETEALKVLWSLAANDYTLDLRPLQQIIANFLSQ